MSQKSFFSVSLGLATFNKNKQILEVFYPKPHLFPKLELIEALAQILGYSGGNQCIQISLEQFETGLNHPLLKHHFLPFKNSLSLVATFLESNTLPTTTAEAYLKLHLLSHRFVKPHQINLDGIFKLLPNIAWTNQGAIDLEELPQKQLQARIENKYLSVDSVDKFPKMTDYVVPSGVRIADTARVRLGAYVGKGTTIMHEGFINFNAGTIGPNMVEGRISAGVIVESGSDLGGGCSTMGTLSGGNQTIISVGKDCLIGANAGLGIPLGDRCTIEAGLYITAGTKITLLDEKGSAIETIKAFQLSGKSDLLFRRNSQSGKVECKTNQSAIQLNEALHSNN